MDTRKTGFTNILTLDSSIIVDLRYATTNNFTGKVIYDFTTAIARTGTALKLAEASKMLKKQGYRIKIWDAYRPVKSQEKLFEVYPHPEFVAKPNPNFSHQKGVTFDLTICDMDGNELEMQTEFDNFTEAAHRDAKRTSEQERNYQIMNEVMIEVGFVGYENEWWDYRDSEMDSYEPATADPNQY
ncbi:M15 family metallopeptidase [Companilactobacillus ginsenosidimutans]|uniref:D-alanyl-D-alanine dipeptidase n=1 Tax=Companilactobacillus ginsenosidimutans TaxID=1007676 RepID=A0A0H4QJ89_9LACO|nr:M15 family metallopeptidase [Companilactobacillus ginsenosidimutans]AKP67111.1 D-alanyl-D-alanine dipeptidase [Companilactobacillus ginsenosidimutans]